MSESNSEGAKGGLTAEEVDAKIKAGVKALVAEHNGSENAALLRLYDDNYRERDKRRAAESKVPPEGAVVLTGDDAAEWGKFRGLGKYSDVNKRLGDGKAASDRLADIDLTERLRGLGKEAGFAPSVFARLAKQDGIQVEQEEGRDGKAGRVLVKGEDGKATPIQEYAERHWPEFLPSLKADAGDGARRPPATPQPNFNRTPPPPPAKGDDPYRDLPYEHAPPPM